MEGHDKMATFPCLPLWTDAYLADTKHLTTEEHGAYFLLLIQAWRSPGCSLPDDDALLARHAGMSVAKWATKKATIMVFWKLDKRRKAWVQKRLRKEREKAAEKKRKASDSAATRWKDKKTGDANALPTQCSPEPSPTPHEKPSGFSVREARKKPRGWVEKKTAFDALNNVHDRIDRNELQQRNEAGIDGVGGTVLQLSSASR